MPEKAGGVDLKTLNWKQLKATEQEFKATFEKGWKDGLRGFPLFIQAFTQSWISFFSEIVVEPTRLMRFLYSILDFFVLRDLLLAAKDPKIFEGKNDFDRFHGACHFANVTRDEDILLIFELFDETSKHHAIWKSLSPFTPVHVISDFLCIPSLQQSAENQLRRLLEPNNMKKKVGSFVPPQFSPDPQPRNDLLYSIFVALQEPLKKEDADRLAGMYFDELRNAQDQLLRLKLAALEVVLLHKVALDISNFDPLAEKLKEWENSRSRNFLLEIKDPQKHMFFLQSLSPVDKMTKILGNQEACRILKIPEVFKLDKDPKAKKLLEGKEKLGSAILKSIRILSLDHFFKASSPVREDSRTIEFFKNFRQYHGIKHLPFLVYAYNWIHDHFAGVIDREKALEISFQDAIKILGNYGAQVDGTRLLNKLKTIWNTIVKAYPNYKICGIAERAGETGIPIFGENFRLSALIDFGIDSFSFDHLFRLIKEICDLQNKIISDRVEEYDVSNLDSDLESISILFQAEDDEKSLSWTKHFAQLTRNDVDYDIEGIHSQVSTFPLFVSLISLDK